MKKYALKSKKHFNAPSLFVNPQSKLDAQELRRALTDHSEDSKNLEGIVVSLQDWKEVQQGLNLQQSTLTKIDIDGKLSFIDPGFHIIFQGYSDDKNNLMNVEVGKKKIGDHQLIPGGLRLRDVVSAITAMKRNKTMEKSERYIKEVYPYMDNLVNPTMKTEIEYNSDVIIIPSVPITLPSMITRQTTQAKKMNKSGKVLSDTIFAKEMKKRDLMFMLTLNMSVAQEEYYDDLINTVIIKDNNNDETIFPDQIGIRLMNDSSDVEKTQSFLDFLARLTRTLQNYKKEIPIHVFNVRENGYVMFTYGATTITTPIATSQYIRRGSSTGSFTITKGKYYHPLHMLDYRYEKMLSLSRSFDYVLPCHCKECQKTQKLLNGKRTLELI